jgi:hypothetical protein
VGGWMIAILATLKFWGKRKPKRTLLFRYLFLLPLLIMQEKYNYLKIIIAQTILEKHSIMNFSCIIGSNISFPNFLEMCIYGGFKCIIWYFDNKLITGPLGIFWPWGLDIIKPVFYFHFSDVAEVAIGIHKTI